MSRFLRAAALALAFAAPALANAADGGQFDFTIAGFRIGTLSMSFDKAGADYAASSRIDSAGLVGAFADFYFDGSARGRLNDDGTVVPELYTAVSKSPRALRNTRIDWKGGVPVKVSVQPPRSTAPNPADQGGSLDPVSAGLRLFRTVPAAALCNTTVDVFDGSRLSRLKLDAPKRSGDSMVCEGTYARVEGESHSMGDSRQFPFQLTFGPAEDGQFRLDRIEAPTGYGRAVIARR